MICRPPAKPFHVNKAPCHAYDCVDTPSLFHDGVVIPVLMLLVLLKEALVYLDDRPSDLGQQGWFGEDVMHIRSGHRNDRT